MRSQNHKIIKTGALILTFLLVMVTEATTVGNIIYVDDSSIGANDGTSWTDAYNYLQDALADANTAEKPVEIYVAQGVYTPDQGASVTRGDPHAEFQLINGVTVLGGFAGVGATEPDARYIEAYKTILSGDLAGDDADIDNLDELHDDPTRAENSICVVSGGDPVWLNIAGEIDETAVLDGVTITAGGFCMRIWFGNPTVANCTFTNAREGVYNFNSHQRLTNCIFEGLWSEAVRNSMEGLLTLTDCLFIGNKSGIVSFSGGDVTVRDCTFVGDRTMKSRGAIDFSGDNLKLYNCEFRNIIAGGVAGVRARVEGEFIAENCIFTGNMGDAIDQRGERMVVLNCVFAGNQGRAIDSSGRYVIIENCTFSDNTSDRGGSALDTWHGAKVSNCIFWGNSSPAIEGSFNFFEETMLNFCNVEGGWPGEGNIDVDPCFVSPGYWDLNDTPEDANDDFWVDGDYHLQSQAGHWDQQSQTWVQDGMTSPCIDAGDPNSPIGTEPFPNGGRLNMGTYGAGDKASKSYFGKPVCEVIMAGDINGDCVVDFKDEAILISHWLMQGDDFINKPPTVRLLEPQDGDRIAWRGPTTFRAEANDPDGKVDEVRFYAKYESSDRTRIRGFGDSDGSDGWEREFTWPEDADFGEWTAWAEATDNEGLVGVSPEIKLILYRP